MRQKLIIFEGIASSGKTTLINKLKDKLASDFSVKVISETETLMPLIDNKSPETAITFLKECLENTLKNFQEEVFIIDRFHLTHAFRTNTTLSDFKDIEDKLKILYTPFLILLTIDDELIKQRITKTAELRGTTWAKGKQGTIDEKVEYYKNQQEELIHLVKESEINSLLLNTSHMNWNELTKSIYSFII